MDSKAAVEAKRDTSKWSRMPQVLQTSIASFLDMATRNTWASTCWAFAEAARCHASWFDRFYMDICTQTHKVRLGFEATSGGVPTDRVVARLQPWSGRGIRVRQWSFRSCACPAAQQVWRAFLAAVNLGGLEGLWLDRGVLAVPATPAATAAPVALAAPTAPTPAAAVASASTAAIATAPTTAIVTTPTTVSALPAPTASSGGFQPLDLSICASSLTQASFLHCDIPDARVVAQLHKLHTLYLLGTTGPSQWDRRWPESLCRALQGATQLPLLRSLTISTGGLEKREKSAEMIHSMLQCRALTYLSVCMAQWPSDVRDLSVLNQLQFLELTVINPWEVGMGAAPAHVHVHTPARAPWRLPPQLQTLILFQQIRVRSGPENDWQDALITDILQAAPPSLTTLQVRHGLSDDSVRAIGKLSGLRNLVLDSSFCATCTSLAPLQQLKHLDCLYLHAVQAHPLVWRTLFETSFPHLRALLLHDCQCNMPVLSLVLPVALPALIHLDVCTRDVDDGKEKQEMEEHADLATKDMERVMPALEPRERADMLRRFFPRLQHVAWKLLSKRRAQAGGCMTHVLDPHGHPIFLPPLPLAPPTPPAPSAEDLVAQFLV